MLDLERLVQEIRERGPRRVVIDIRGEAVTPFSAKERGITPAVVFIRNDGWSLGAPAEFEGAAEEMCLNDWVAVTRKPFATFEEYSSFR